MISKNGHSQRLPQTITKWFAALLDVAPYDIQLKIDKIMKIAQYFDGASVRKS
jgi:hypothetical protein